MVAVTAQQVQLTAFEGSTLSDLTQAEREVYEAVERGGRGAREYARETGRSPGTISNLLRRAREKLDEDGGASV